MSFVETDPDVNAAAGEIDFKLITSFLPVQAARMYRAISERFAFCATTRSTADEDGSGATTTRPGIPQHGGLPTGR